MNRLQRYALMDKNAPYFGYAVQDLMETAGSALAQQLVEDFGTKNNIHIFCGLGNNGGDGFVLARYLSHANKVTVHLIGNPRYLETMEAQKNFAKLETVPVTVKTYFDSTELPKKIKADIIVEALFGLGLKGKLREPFKSAVILMNKTKAKRVAVDVPVPGFKFNKIYCLGIKKHAKCSAILDFGLPNYLENYTGPSYVKALNKRTLKSHKGDNGKVLVVAGSKQWHGASLFAGLTASYFSDLVFVLTDKHNIPIVKKSSKEFIVSALNKKTLKEFEKRSHVVLFGPGLAFSSENKSLINWFLKTYKNKKTVLDATALRLLNKQLLHKNCILTPHGNEFKTLFKKEPHSRNAIAMAKKYNCTIVLKQPVETITNGKETLYDFYGNFGLTTGGTGDILSGLIAAFAAKNDFLLSAAASTFLLGFTADWLAEEKGPNYTSTQILEKLQLAVKCIQKS